ncbi:GTP-binding protein [Helicobacter saguini]|uniref:GTP-binding protein n=1 Tax=Helicobacter saguini TaxID=1548018 RepID=A0A099B8W3_9HELI|nr:dynamin family protein [Helicobacter saguini]MWV62920.1 GTP-binding protein [Helicobacter saguini]MWV66410.1 GTP-binding protein [Helicobacter saguini]MWV68761.1 GTP-binding protein [Helicobacter saguini]MWV71685.1 GTP-binding protein [Helicobacter saguini]TLD91869.1 GTP-binding protein [Helicobacter saguini]
MSENLLNGNVFESFIQEVLSQILNANSDNPLYTLINKTRYALSQSEPLDSKQKATLESLQEQVNTPMKVAIIGQFSSGKSTFLNALLGSEILPSGITPVTAKVCEISYGDENALQVVYKNGKEVGKSLEFLQNVDDIENEKIAYYRLFAPLPLLKSINFLDTPGFNSQRESDTATTNSILQSVDGIIWLTLIDNVGKNSEKEILQKYIKNYANKSLCVLNQKDRCKDSNEVETSLNYAKVAFDGFFEKIVAISAKQALDSKKMESRAASHVEQGETSSLKADSKELYKDSNIESIINFLQDSIAPQAQIAKEYRIKRALKALLIAEKKRIHKQNMCHKDLIKILSKYTEKLRFNILQFSDKNGSFETRFKGEFSAIDSNFNALAVLIFDSFELRDVEILRQSKNMLGLKKENVQVKKVNFLPKERLLNSLVSEDFELFREAKKLGFQLLKIGQDFESLSKENERDLESEIANFVESSLHYLDSNINSFFNTKIIKSEILDDIFAVQDSCINELNNELSYLQKGLSDNYKVAILLTLERLNYEVYNALEKHKKDPDNLPLYNPTLENTRNLINEGLHFATYQDKLSLNFPLYKKTLWNLTHSLSEICHIKIAKIEQFIESNNAKIARLKECEKSLELNAK